MIIKKLHILQSLVRTTRRTKTANITNDDVTSASHRQNVTMLSSCEVFNINICCFWTTIRFQYGGPSLFVTSNNVQVLTFRMVCARNLYVPAKFRRDPLNGYGVINSHYGGCPPS